MRNIEMDCTSNKQNNVKHFKDMSFYSHMAPLKLGYTS